MTAVAILGASGRMGSTLRDLISASDSLTLAGSWSNMDESLAAALEGADVAIDFSDNAAIPSIISALQKHPIPLVTGTTGLTSDSQQMLVDLSNVLPVLSDGNMSIGVHVLEALAARAATVLSDYDIEILETHHNEKRDAPSGTALKLGRAVAAARGQEFDDVAALSRQGDGKRSVGSIGFAARRGGNVIGDHSVDLYGPSDRLTLAHHAQTRTLFAEGALHAARWLITQPNGLYAIKDMLGEI
ncbi:MAG: 4-hydroxy-tetrahydrodipicolinate reductase [Pseudomonadota bacterium]